MNPPTTPSVGEERRHWERRVNDFHSKVEHALFDEEGNSRIRAVEKKVGHMERAVYNERDESRISGIETDVKDIKELVLRYVDRGKYTIWLLRGLWIVLGCAIGYLWKH